VELDHPDQRLPGPQFPLTGSAPTIPLAGGVITYSIAAGSTAAFRQYLILGGVSGSSPGINIGLIHFPLNIDLFTELMYPLINGPIFSNFQGVTDANGDATATLNVPPMPPSGLGAVLTFAAGLLVPVNASSIPAELTIVP
jgi:hypothetical protein